MSNSRNEMWDAAWVRAWARMREVFPTHLSMYIERARFARDEQERLFAEMERAATEAGWAVLVGKALPRPWPMPPLQPPPTRSQLEVDMVKVSRGAGDVESMFGSLKEGPMPHNEQWRNIARIHFQEGFMALRRSIHLPNTTDNKF